MLCLRAPPACLAPAALLLLLLLQGIHTVNPNKCGSDFDGNAANYCLFAAAGHPHVGCGWPSLL
jgi:hypothetical protein